MVTAFEWYRWIPPHYIEPPVDPDPPATDLAWTVRSLPFAQVLRWPAVGVIAGKVYMVMGSKGGAESLGVVVYDPVTDTWDTSAAMAGLARSRFAGAGVVGGRLLAPGGVRGSYVASVTYWEPPATSNSLANQPAVRADGSSAASVIGTTLYVAGGSSGSSLSSASTSLYAYDSIANTWAARAAMPTARVQHTTQAAGGKLYVIGGRALVASVDTVLDTVYAYDPVSNTWAACAPLPVPVVYPAAAATDTHIYVLGGIPSGSATPVANVWRYTIATDTWEAMTPLPSARADAVAAIVADKLYVLAGRMTSSPSTDPGPVLVSTLPATDPGGDPDPIFVPGAWELDEDLSSALMSWTITYGRQDSSDKAATTTATVGLGAARAGACPVAGERFRLAVDGDPRFTGETTDPKIDPPARTYSVTGAGRLGRARRRPIKGGRTYPLALDGARVARILDDAADGDLEVSVDTGTALILPPTRNVAAGQLLDLTSDSTGGQLVEQLDGSIQWHDADHRRGAPIALTLDAGEILNDLTFEQHVGDLVNDAQISYGYDAATVRVTDPVSIDEREVYPASVSTALVDESDAYDLGTYLVGRRSEPVWQLPNLLVDLGRGVDPAKRAALLALRFGDRIAVTGLPALAPYAADVELYVEGINETARVPRPGQVDWRLSIAVSDPALSGVSIRWKDAPAALAWDGVDPVLTWLDLARMENPTDLEA